MLRLVGFGVLVFVVWRLLGFVPFLGNSFISLWVAVILSSWGLSRLGTRLLSAGRIGAQVRSLAATDTPTNHGKLGSLLLAQGRLRAAVPHLETAVEGEPESCEWGYRLGQAQLALGRPEEAAAALGPVLERDQEYAYGAAQLLLVEALRRQGRLEEALAALDVFERNHGDSPESAYRRGVVLRGLGRKEEAGVSFGRVSALAARAPRYQRREAYGWSFRAFFRRFV